ncbi:MAG TPA: 2-dehydropantoate 2-reductase [Rhodocyclaceae bacterium]|nr:MAG: 2-dehydropantoate 2-reductase [Betaproteobacteria bacterium CG2_30_68_42]PIV74054.1 MAG: 2-dehydropantoate 2-reductase [Rhodocyclales bacterium CG17_big_fil_post_rev_8_21_14_2_50_68_7]PIX75882.1 MAG: 2-dehydropantoate 2-reductase [Rhodocyclales bacterium CG_4_10_14_3_um_filter_68_10]HCX34265.1 2-dehydropantoate 2-reductase [Rhodocyclaceae bacterium]
MSESFHSVAVVGAGAVGSYYGALLARAGRRVTLIGRRAHVQAIERDGLRLEMAGRMEVVRVAASVDLAAARGADLVLFCVKSSDTDAVARELAPHLDAGALVLSLQNGVENAAMIAQYVRQSVVPAVVYVATAMPQPGCVRHHGGGNLVIGAIDAAASRDPALARRLQALVEFFAGAAVPVRIADDVTAELWSKLMVNCAYNAISGLAQANYARLAALPAVRALQHAIVREVVALAAAEHVALPLGPSLEAMERIAVAMPDQFSSTAQDMARRKPTEIDHLNGFVARRGRERGVATPVNQTLHALVKLIEAGYGGAA